MSMLDPVAPPALPSPVDEGASASVGPTHAEVLAEAAVTKQLEEQLCACDDPLAVVEEQVRLADAQQAVATAAVEKATAEAGPVVAESSVAEPSKIEDDPAAVWPSMITERDTALAHPIVQARTARMMSRQLMLLCALAVMYTLYFAQAVFIPLAMSLVMYLLLRPVVQWLCRRRIPAMASASLCLIAIGLVGVGCVLPLVSVAHEWMADLPQEMEVAKKKLSVVLEPLDRISGTWTRIEKLASGTQERLPSQVVVQQPELTGNTVLLSTTGNMLGSLMVVVVLVFFLLTSGDQLLNRLLEQFPRFREKRRIVELILSVQNGISFYLFTITQINVALGIVVGLMAWAYGLPNPALWGLMATAFNFVPFVGPAVCGAILAFVALITFDSFGYACLVPLTFYGIAIIEGNVITPALIGRQMSLSPIMVLVFLLFWGWMWGIAGAALAVPILAILKLGLDRFEPTQSAAALLGD